MLQKMFKNIPQKKQKKEREMFEVFLNYQQILLRTMKHFINFQNRLPKSRKYYMLKLVVAY